MVNLEFTPQDGAYVCETQGFKGILQIDRRTTGKIEVYVRLQGFSNYLCVYEEIGTTLHKEVDITSLDQMKIVSYTEVIKAGYESS